MLDMQMAENIKLNIAKNDYFILFQHRLCLQCFDSVGWVAGGLTRVVPEKGLLNGCVCNRCVDGIREKFEKPTE